LTSPDEWVLAVDFGTTNTVAAVTKARGTEILMVDGRAVTPSAVFLNPDGKTWVAGDSAMRASRRGPGWFEPDPKRWVPAGTLRLGGQDIPVGMAITAVLRLIVQEAAIQHDGRRPSVFVVTHPAHWDAARVGVLVAAAAEAAGHDWPQPVALSEPVAAARAILDMFDVPQEARLVVLDLGGGTVDASVVDRFGDTLTVVGRPWSRDDVGGDDYDVRLARWLVAEAGAPGLYDRLANSEDRRERELAADIRADARDAKEHLSRQRTVSVQLPRSPPDLPEITPVMITRSQLEALIRGAPGHDPGLAESVEMVSGVLDTAPPGPPFAGVLLTGGGARIPMLGVLASERAGRPIFNVGSPVTAVAQGAAQFAWRALASVARLWTPVGERAPVAGSQPSPRAGPVVDDDVRFTVYRPEVLTPGRWASLLVFAHKTTLVVEPGQEPVDPLQVVEDRARAYFDSAVPRPAGVDAQQGLIHGAQLRIVPDLPGIQCNPREQQFEWWEPVHEARFGLRAGPDLAGTVVRGAVRIWCGALIFGEVSITIRIAAGGPPVQAPAVTTPLSPYRKIFASYSHQDRSVVDSFAEAARALGDRYLQDVLTLRAGEPWDARLLELIEDADVFQLFWSRNSMRSPHCRKEWEHALTLRRPLFIRPVYWEDPLPADPGQELPPATLRVLHFVRVPALRPGAEPPAPPPPPAPAPAAPARQQAGPPAGQQVEDQQVEDLYDEALAAFWTDQFDRAVALLQQVLAARPHHLEAIGKLQQARRQQELAASYTRACAAADAGDWEQAVEGFSRVSEIDPGYRDVAARLDNARKQQQIAALRVEARRLYQARQWAATVTVGHRLRALDPDAADLDDLMTLARTELAAAERAEHIATVTPTLPARAPGPAGASGQPGRYDITERPTVVRTFDAYAATGAYAAINSVAFGVDPRWLAASTTGGPVLIWDITTARKHLHLANTAWAILFSADGRWLVTADRQTARIWDTTTGKQLLSVSHRSSRDHALALAPDNRWLATGSPGNAARIWDTSDGQALMTISLGQPPDSLTVPDGVDGLAFSPDGRRLATASTDTTARIWDVATGEPLLEISHGGAVSAVTFSPDGRRLATASADKTARIWDTDSGEPLLEISHGGAVSAVTFSPDGRRLATASADKTARIWDTDTGRMLARLPHKKAVRDVAFSPDGDCLATASKQSAQVWALH
jgi:TIR domain/Hsp70 protein/WD domain, G-beta repeat